MLARLFLCAGFVAAVFAAWNLEDAALRVDEDPAPAPALEFDEASIEIAPVADWLVCLTTDDDLKAELHRITDARELSRKLDDVHITVSRLLDAKRKVLARLAAGQMTLWQAAAAFHDLQRMWPGFNRHMFESRYSGQCEEERFCRQVIAAVRAQIKGKPEVVEALALSLEREAKKKFGQGFEQSLRAGEAPPASFQDLAAVK